MDEERNEVYERIPWETLDKKSGDKQWLLYVVAGSIALGALAYSFVKNQPSAPTVEAVPIVTTTAHVAMEAAPDVESAVPPTTTAKSPVLYSEADLYALDPRDMSVEVAAYAEWFAVEYFSYDGSESATLRELLPETVPLPTAEEGTQVFVDWVGTISVAQTAPDVFAVDVLVRSLLSTDDNGFSRLPVRMVTVTLGLTEDGRIRLTNLPKSAAFTGLDGPELSSLPDDLALRVEADLGEVFGGSLREDGRWDVVSLAVGPDGVTRPVVVAYP